MIVRFVVRLQIVLFSMVLLSCDPERDNNEVEGKIEQLISQMTLEEKVGQLMQKNGDHAQLDELISQGKVGSVLNEPDPERIHELQKIAVEKSSHGIPLLIGRDVIHGFRTITPIPLGQAASWNVDLVESGARNAAVEAASQGINWSFAPMIDVTRDPRWGRIAESFGEDHLMNGVFGAAVVRGFQGENLSDPTTIASCPKHYSGYGWAEGGRDYNTVSIPQNQLHDIILPPFKMAIDAGAASIMTAFNEVNGIPASGDKALLNDLLRKEWGFEGVVLSDWESVIQMVVHGYTPNEKEAAYKAMQASLDMEMASTAYEAYLPQLAREGRISEKQIDDAVRRILKMKFELGLFDDPYAHIHNEFPELLDKKHLEDAKELAMESHVLLKNNDVLPLDDNTKTIALIGPLADAPHDQLGTWIFDGRKEDAITPLQSLRERAEKNDINLLYHPALEISRSTEIMNRSAIMRDVRRADVVLLFLGEESILSGESHCLANIDLPGAQEELVELIASANTPVATIIMAGRPVTFEKVQPYMDAVLYAWHPGTMAGPAVTELIFGDHSPSGKLPVTFPRHVGTIPIYYNHKNTGKPASDETWERYDEIPTEAPQLSIGNTSHYLDYGFEPMYPFGYGLSYTTFEYDNLQLSKTELEADEILQVSVTLKNTGKHRAKEVVQLYTRQLFGSRTRPVKELRAFEKVELDPGQETKVVIDLDLQDIGFHNPDMEYVVEPGDYHLWVGTDSQTGLQGAFEIL
ncbi:MAG: beta-glucosidase BglX [Bacteroidales bacterium]